MRFERATGPMLCLALTAILAAPARGEAAGAESESCRAAPAQADEIVSVAARGELAMRSGRRIVLSGVRWPDEAALAREATSWLERQRGAALAVRQRGAEDRWGRIRADIVAAGDPAQDLASGLIEAGLAHADAGEDDTLCRPDLLAREAAPREAGLGVWSRPVFEAVDGARLAQAEGDFVVAQGRVLSVGERPKRSYLNFVRRGQSGLTVTVPKRTWRIMQDHGLSAATLKGRLVRVRGRIEVWRGPTLDVASAEMIEVLEGEQALRR